MSTSFFGGFNFLTDTFLRQLGVVLRLLGAVLRQLGVVLRPFGAFWCVCGHTMGRIALS